MPDGLAQRLDDDVLALLRLDANGQVQRLKRQGWAQGACMMHVPTAGGAQEMFCLPRNRVGMWLVTLDASRVRPEVGLLLT